MQIQKNLWQAGAELCQTQHSWGWAMLIEAKASVEDGFTVNKAKHGLVYMWEAKSYHIVMLEFQCYLILSWYGLIGTFTGMAGMVGWID